MQLDTSTVLFVTTFQLHPMAGGGPARVLAMVDYFRSRGMRVEVVMVAHNSEAYDALAERFDRLWVFNPKGKATRKSWEEKVGSNGVGRTLLSAAVPVWRSMKAAGRGLKGSLLSPLDNPDSAIQRNRKKGFEAYAAKVIRQVRPNAVIAECVWTARCFIDIPPNALKILNTHDIQHLRFSCAQEAGYEVSRLVCTREEEIRELERADILLAIQEEEGNKLLEMCPEKRVLVVEHAHQVLPEVRPPREPRTVLFVGNFYEPNNFGIRDFIQYAWPSIRGQHPDARLVICGKVCQSIEGPVPAGVELKGLVPSLEEYYEAATVVINPIPFGTGLKIKTVEALALGKCLVSTECGILGLPAPSEEEPYCRVARVEEMGPVVADLLSHPEKRRTCEEAALSLAERRFSPQACFEELTEIINRVPCY